MSAVRRLQKARATIGEYLAAERRAENRHQYIDGEVLAMAGESGAHADISANLIQHIMNHLADSPCRIRVRDTKVRSGPSDLLSKRGLFSYPDLDYVLVSQDRPTVEVFHRQSDGTWQLTYVEGLDQEATIPSIRCTLKLADVFHRIAFPPDPDAEPSANDGDS